MAVSGVSGACHRVCRIAKMILYDVRRDHPPFALQASRGDDAVQRQQSGRRASCRLQDEPDRENGDDEAFKTESVGADEATKSDEAFRFWDSSPLSVCPPEPPSLSPLHSGGDGLLCTERRGPEAMLPLTSL